MKCSRLFIRAFFNLQKSLIESLVAFKRWDMSCTQRESRWLEIIDDKLRRLEEGDMRYR